MNEIKHYYLHVDLDAFFASVEQLDNPEYRGKPIIVGGKPEDRRSVVSTASYEARKFGVHSAMPTAKAYQLCPQGIFVYPRMKRYSELSWQIMNIFRDFSPDVQQMSIDEAFIDLTGTEKLFGSPRETAMKLKQRVKDETGLTVSVGLAPTKYLAKIASDMNKPDGFYSIEEGTEQEFMLNLPLKKVWGIGDKTYTSLKTNGLFTTRDIYEKSLESLVFVYGNSMGNFLYNVVRGIDTVNFDRKAKSHSISNETTFPIDIYDTYTIETAILELCHSIIFRILKENGFSRTVMVKIRYEDFSTVSIQQTFNRSILTLDSLYNAAKELFEKKYENGRGIRLIGIGLENIEPSEKPFQPGLFEEDTEKKQNVEKAILKLTKKHPEINIQKARMLQKLKLIPVLFLLMFTARPAAAYEIEGYWKGEMDGSIDMTFGMGNPFGISTPLPVFKQEVDISAFADITPNLTFSLQFLDEFKNNTYTLRYQSQGLLQSLVFSNRGITMPSVFSSEYNGYGVSGGNNEAPGIMLHLNDYKNNRWMADFMVRYEMTEAKSVVFFGNNSVKDLEKAPDDYAVSDTFVIPSDVIAQINGVYIQNSAGSYKDSKGHSFSKLDASDYLIIPGQNLLLISQNAGKGNTKSIPHIIITFSTPDACTKLLQDTGSYTDEQSYAGKIQQYFQSRSKEIALSDFSSITESSLVVDIDGKKGFIIQSPYSFSPYACANKYEFSAGTDCDFFIKDRYSQTQASEYTAQAASDLSLVYSFTADSFFNEKQTCAYVLNPAQKFTPLDPQYRYPFADRYPGLYLGLKSDSPYLITARHYTPVKEYDIGKKASNGTVRVYKNGILDAGAVYDSDTGFVTLSSPAGELDKIYITWNEEGSIKDGGAFTTGLGFIWNFNPFLKADLSFTGQYPFTPSKDYSTADSASTSFSSLTAGIDFTRDKIKAYDAVSVALQNEDTTNKMLAVTFEDTGSQTFYLSASAGSSVENAPVLNSQNLLYPSLDEKDECTVHNFTGLKDSYISGSKIPLTFNFEGQGLKENLWAAVEISIPHAHNMYCVQDYEMAFLPDSSLTGQNLDVYLELCTDTQETTPGAVWLISSTTDKNVLFSLDINKPSWQTVKVRLTDAQRSKLHNCTLARIVIVKKNYIPGTDKTGGTLYTGPYMLCEQPLFINSIEPVFSAANIINDTAAQISWSLDTAVTDENKRQITADVYFAPVDFSNYQTVSFEFAAQENADVTFILEDSSDACALSCKISKDVLQNYVSSAVAYHTLSVSTDGSKVDIDGNTISQDRYELSINRMVIPCLYKILIVPQKDGQTPYNGAFYAGNVCYNNSSPVFASKNQIGFSFKDGNAYVDAVSSQGIALKTSDKSVTSKYINARLNTGITFAGLFAGSDVQYSGSRINAGHSFKSVNPVFQIITLEETYRYSQSDSSSEKKNELDLDFEKLNVPFKLNSKIITKNSATAKAYGSSFAAGSSFATGKARFSINSGLDMNGKNQKALSQQSSNYFVNWYDLSKLEFSNGNLFDVRNIDFNTILTAGLPFAQLAPSVTFSLTGNKSSSISNLYLTSDVLSVSVPFGFKNNSFSASIFHKSGIEQNIIADGFADDLSLIFGGQNLFSTFYRTIPFYTIFKTNLVSSLNQIVTQNNLHALTQTMQYNLSWRRKLYNSIHDLYIPSGLSADFSRDVTATALDSTDIYQIRSTVSWNWINLFGTSSPIQLFKWYRQEENQSSLSAALKIPGSGQNQQNRTFLINSYGQLLFYITDTSILTIKNEEAYNTGFNENPAEWKVTLMASWERDTTKSLALELTRLLLPDYNLENTKTTVKDSISFMIGRQEKLLTQNYEYNRSSKIQFKTNYYLNSQAGILFNYTQNKTMKLSVKYNLGLKINY